MKRRIVLSMVLSLVLLVVPILSSGSPQQKYPTKPITVIIQYPVGGTVDTGARTLKPYWEERLGVDLIIKNMPGAAGERALTYLAKQKADGYTVGFWSAPGQNFIISTRKPYFGVNSFDYIGCEQGDPNLLVVRKDDPRFDSIGDFVGYGKENPGTLTVAIPGTFNDDHMYLLEMEEALDIDLVPVPFPGSPECRAALMGGHVDAMLENTLSFEGYVGKDEPLQVLVYFWPEPPMEAKAPTFLETYPEAAQDHPLLEKSGSYRGVLAPKGIPQERLEVLRETFEDAMKDPDFKKDAEKRGIKLLYLSGPEWEEMVKEQQKTADKVAKKLGKYVGD